MLIISLFLYSSGIRAALRILVYNCTSKLRDDSLNHNSNTQVGGVPHFTLSCRPIRTYLLKFLPRSVFWLPTKGTKPSQGSTHPLLPCCPQCGAQYTSPGICSRKYHWSRLEKNHFLRRGHIFDSKWWATSCASPRWPAFWPTFRC